METMPEKVEEATDAEFIIASGSLPPGVPSNVYAQLAKIAKNKGAKFIVDTSGAALADAVDEGVYLLKPNLGELSSLAGIKEISHADVPAVARTIIAKAKCDVIVVSMGAAGAMVVTETIAERLVPHQLNAKVRWAQATVWSPVSLIIFRRIKACQKQQNMV